MADSFPAKLAHVSFSDLQNFRRANPDDRIYTGIDDTFDADDLNDIILPECMGGQVWLRVASVRAHRVSQQVFHCRGNMEPFCQSIQVEFDAFLRRTYLLSATAQVNCNVIQISIFISSVLKEGGPAYRLPSLSTVTGQPGRRMQVVNHQSAIDTREMLIQKGADYHAPFT